MALIIANWKMNFTLQDAEIFCARLMELKKQHELIIAAPTPYLSYLANKFSSIQFASQDVSIYNNFGSYTGEYSAAILKSCNVKYVIVGHAERRKLFKETDNIINQKILNILSSELIPVICIGHEFIKDNIDRQISVIKMQLNNIKFHNKSCIIAYEPVSFIGTGKNPNIQELAIIVQGIKNHLITTGIVNNVQLVYGGSVTCENINQILTINHIDGVLVGASALSYESMRMILQ